MSSFQALVEKIESSCKKFDHSHKGSLTVDEYFNVLKLQNGIDISKDEVQVSLAIFNCEKNFSFPRYSLFLNQLIVKTKNCEGRPSIC